MRKFLILLACILYAIGIQAQEIRYVTESGTGNGLSWENASGDIQLMMNELGEVGGGEVWVAKGTYTPMYKIAEECLVNWYDEETGERKEEIRSTIDRDKSFVLVKNVKLFGGFRGNESLISERDWKTNCCILDGHINSSTQVRHLVISAGDVGAAKIDGFTITGADASYEYEGEIILNNIVISFYMGGGVVISDSSPVLENLIIKRNKAYSGGGIYLKSSSSIIKNATIFDNIVVNSGGGIDITYGSPSLENVVVSNNIQGGIDIFYSSPILTNMLISGNIGGAGLNIYYGSSILTNMTIVDNEFGMRVSSSSPIVRNSIIWSNGINVDNRNENSILQCQYNLIEGLNPEGEGNLDGTNKKNNPKFADSDLQDYRLQIGSPCIDKGNNDYLNSGIISDIHGNSRIYGSKVDLGAIESQGDNIAIHRKTIYVNKNVAGGDGSGNSWENAYIELADAIKDASEKLVTEIWVAAGSYSPKYKVAEINQNGVLTSDRDQSFVLPKNVKIYGGFSGIETELSERDWKSNPTILNGNFISRHVVVSAGFVGSTCLDGFSITEGNASNDPGSVLVNGLEINNVIGGGIHICYSSPFLANLRFYNNNGYLGTGIFNGRNSKATIVNSIIENNGIGYGIYNYGCSPRIENTIVRDNQGMGIDNSSASPILINLLIYGNKGGISNMYESTPVLINITITDNTGIGLYNYRTSPLIYNSIIWGNKNSTGEPNNVNESETATPQFFYTLVEGYLFNGEGNLDGKEGNNPLFVDTENRNYHLQAGSPCIDKGNNTCIKDYSVIFDLDKNSRIYNNTVDFGAYEYVNGNYLPEIQFNTTQHSICQKENILYINSDEKEQVNIHSITGRLVFSENKTVGDIKINATGFEKGVYIVTGTSGWKTKVIIR